MRLSRLCAILPLCAPLKTEADGEVSDLCCDSRLARPNDLFFAFEGSMDAHAFVWDAYKKGCRMFVLSRPVSFPDDAITVLVTNTRAAYALACRVFFPLASPLRLIGVTGTKGKTTIATYASRLFSQNGFRVLQIGTGGIWEDGKHTPTKNTTPDAYTIYSALSRFSQGGAGVAVLEVSSQAYLQHRVTGLCFHASVFSNFFPDHIGTGEHPDLRNYLDCKLQLFQNSDFGILNREDPAFCDFSAVCPNGYLTYGRTKSADLWASDPLCRPDGISFLLHRNGQVYPLSLPLPGLYNMDNALAVCALALQQGLPLSSLPSVFTQGVAGRSERYPLPNQGLAVIDYAHNPASLEAVLQALRPHCKGTLYCLFGSVGGRCQSRRAELGRVAGREADVCILTSDDPGWEDPVAISEEIAWGIPKTTPYHIIPDRKEAILFALEHMGAGDVLLLAGKGAEEYQKIAGVQVPFSERRILETWCKQRSKKQGE